MTSPFAELGLARDLVDHLSAQGITEPTAIQAATLPDMLAGLDVLAAAPTGSGKTIAFGAPLVARVGKGSPNRPAALILTPTRELAAQIHGVLAPMCRLRDRWAATVYGGVKQSTQVNNLRRGVDVLVACPGRLEDLIEQGHVKLDKVSIVVIDEADRMSDMGFLPCVRRIVDQTRADRQTVLFSATLDGAADDLARTHLKNPVRHSVKANEEEAGKATHLFWSADPSQRPELSAQIVRKAGRTVLFTRTKHGADRLTDRLNELGVRAAVIHGGRSQQQRDKSLSDFHRGHVAALVATDVAARGIHVEKVACVVHVDLPDSPTDYQHRSGRTARAGERGMVVSLVTPDQRRHARNVQRHFGFPSGHGRPDMEHIEAGEVPVIVERTPGTRDRDDRPARAFERPRDNGPRSYGDRPRPSGDRKPYGRNDERGTGGRAERTDRPSDRPSGGYARPGSTGPRADRPAGNGYRGNNERPATSGYQGNNPRPASNGYRGNDDRGGRPAATGYRATGERPATGYRSTNDRTTGERPYERPATSGYQGNNPRPTTSGYQGNNPRPTTSGYQGNNPRPTTSGYQGNNPRPATGGYQGNNPRPATGGYQGNNPRPATGGYRGSGGDAGRPGAGGYRAASASPRAERSFGRDARPAVDDHHPLDGRSTRPTRPVRTGGPGGFTQPRKGTVARPVRPTRPAR